MFKTLKIFNRPTFTPFYLQRTTHSHIRGIFMYLNTSHNIFNNRSKVTQWMRQGLCSQTALNSHPAQLLSEWLRAFHLTSLLPSFLIYRMRIIYISFSYACYKDVLGAVSMVSPDTHQGRTNVGNYRYHRLSTRRVCSPPSLLLPSSLCLSSLPWFSSPSSSNLIFGTYCRHWTEDPHFKIRKWDTVRGFDSLKNHLYPSIVSV